MIDPDKRFDRIVDTLRQHRHKLTPQRLAIAQVLAASNGHPSIEQIYERIRAVFPTMSLATVYRNVLLIKSLGQALELGFADGSNRYDGNKPYPHPHVVCMKCKKIVDPELDSLADMSAEVEAATGFRVLSHRVDFFGICRDCRADG